MKTTKKLSFLQFIFLAVLITAVAVILPSCSKEADNNQDVGVISLTIEVVDNEGNSTSNEYTTIPGKTLADVLTSYEIASGDESEYGLYIKTVNGLTADYDVDGSYWALYSNGEYLMTGASSTYVNDGDHYELVYTVYTEEAAG